MNTTMTSIGGTLQKRFCAFLVLTFSLYLILIHKIKKNVLTRGICFMNRIFLIDFENVQNLNTENLNSNDMIIFFYSTRTPSIKFELLEKILNQHASLEAHSVILGVKNAMDFQLSSYLGYMINICPTSKFFIISNDTGYQCIVDFWKQTKNINIVLKGNIPKKKSKT